jgi:hypothetical protein
MALDLYPTGFASTAETLLKYPSRLVARIEAGGERIRDLPVQLTLLAIFGFGAFGLVLGLTHSALAALLAAPKLVLVGLGSLAVCLPALYVYGRLLGNESTILQVVCEALTALATTGLTLVALCPAWLAFLFLVNHPPHGYFYVMLGSVAFLSLAGLRGIWVLWSALRDGRRSWMHLAAWTAIYGLVGLQSAWMLRPFVGTPHDVDEGFVVVRPLERTAFDAVNRLVVSGVNSASGATLLTPPPEPPPPTGTGE